MDITYFGHSSFKLKGKDASVVTDPFDKKAVGLSMPQVSADIVTVSSEDGAHNMVKQVSGTARRAEPYVVRAPGEYEASGIGIFGWGHFSESNQLDNTERNTIYSIIVDGVRVAHLGNLKEVVDDDMVGNLGTVDVLLVPMGGVGTIGVKEAAAVVEKLSPSIVIPMQYKMDGYSATFADLTEASEFLKLMGVVELAPVDKLKVTKDSLPEGVQVVLLSKS